MRSSSPFKYWCPAGVAIMFEPFENIHHKSFPPINLLSKSEWNIWGRRPTSALNNSRVDVINVDDKDDIPYNQHYLVCLSVCLSVGLASETPKLIHYRLVLFHTPDIVLIDL